MFLFIFYAEMQLILFKDNANRGQNKINKRNSFIYFLCRDAAYPVRFIFRHCHTHTGKTACHTPPDTKNFHRTHLSY